MNQKPVSSKPSSVRMEVDTRAYVLVGVDVLLCCVVGILGRHQEGLRLVSLQEFRAESDCIKRQMLVEDTRKRTAEIVRA